MELVVDNPQMDSPIGTLSFYLWVGFIIVAITLLILMYVNSLRKERRKHYSVSGEIFGALLAKNDIVKGQTFLIVRGGLVIGRVPETCDIVCDNSAVSREHAKIYPIGWRIVIVDMKSKNGTYVNGVRATQTELADGDIITLGKKQPSIFEYRR